MTTSVTKITLFSFLLAMCFSNYFFGQTFQERVILTDSDDSTALKADDIVFDKSGNYCFEGIKNGKEYFYTNADTIGGFSSIGGIYGSNGSIKHTNSDKTDTYWYFKNASGTKVFGPVRGKLRRFMNGGTTQNMAITVTYKDSVYYFANEKLVSRIQIKKADQFGIENDDWCSFSENGRSIYYFKRNDKYFLAVDHNIIDSANFSYNELSINDHGDYIFAEGRQPEKKGGEYDYMFFIHNRDTILGPVRTVWHNELKEHGGYYYSGDDNGTEYIVINNTLKRKARSISNIIIADRLNHLYTYPENGRINITVNSKQFNTPFSELYCPALSANGEFACYGIKDYYLYKFVNGVQDNTPLTRHNVRPTPLYISPQGNSLLCFKTDDSVYFYRDDKLLFPPFSAATAIDIQPYSEILPTRSERGEVKNQNSLIYVAIDTTGYFVYNGQFSKPMMPAKSSRYTRDKQVGDIVAGDFTENGFYFIQKTGDNKFLININNKNYHELDSIKEILPDACYFSGKSLVFYGIRGRSFIQFTFAI